MFLYNFQTVISLFSTKELRTTTEDILQNDMNSKADNNYDFMMLTRSVSN